MRDGLRNHDSFQLGKKLLPQKKKSSFSSSPPNLVPLVWFGQTNKRSLRRKQSWDMGGFPWGHVPYQTSSRCIKRGNPPLSLVPPVSLRVGFPVWSSVAFSHLNPPAPPKATPLDKRPPSLADPRACSLMPRKGPPFPSGQPGASQGVKLDGIVRGFVRLA